MVYRSGNDTIIQPPEYREKSITNTLVNLVLGLLVGAAALWFLVVPAKPRNQSGSQQKVVEYSDKMATLSAELDRMQEEMDASTDSVSTAQSQIEQANTKASGYENLIKAWQAYREAATAQQPSAIEGVNAESLSVEAKVCMTV